jgi:1-deoxy-D-xylulose-5-phosphate reductoisomerase
MKRITLLGSTGSIGQSTLDLIRQNPTLYKAEVLVAHNSAERLVEQAIEFRPKHVVIGSEDHYGKVRDALSSYDIIVAAGYDAVCDAAEIDTDFVMAGIVGLAGLKPTLRAVEKGRVIGLANKEALVCAGPLFMDKVRTHNARLLPVDSEHNAIFQVLNSDHAVEKLILTASGGPFREMSLEHMKDVTVEAALKHPNWEMGAKITVDCATMMNKGLELIEAAYLFDMPEHMIDVLVHPQSIVHSLVLYDDGSYLTQMGSADMRIPISYCLGWPERLKTNCDRLGFDKIKQLTFEAPDTQRFPCLDLARQALKRGGTAPIILNSANEIAVEAFINKKISFLDIARVVEQSLGNIKSKNLESLEEIFEIDAITRDYASGLCYSRLFKVS